MSEPVQLTTGGSAQRYAPEWSGDGKRFAFSDKDGKVYITLLRQKFKANRRLAERTSHRLRMVAEGRFSGV
jgi:Tol biopolymer transport system component